MKFLKTLTLGSLLVAGNAFSAGIGFEVGPFNLQFNAGETPYGYNFKAFLDNPICYAIENQKQLGIIVKVAEKVSEKELKFTTKKVVVEPYAFAVTNEGKPFLRGSVVSEKLVKEVTVKFGDEKFDEGYDWEAGKKKHFFSGWFKSDKSKNLDIESILDVQVLEDSHFDAPKKYKQITDENVRFICQLPEAND